MQPSPEMQLSNDIAAMQRALIASLRASDNDHAWPETDHVLYARWYCKKVFASHIGGVRRPPAAAPPTQAAQAPSGRAVPAAGRAAPHDADAAATAQSWAGQVHRYLRRNEALAGVASAHGPVLGHPFRSGGSDRMP